jgi:hypothetical protein
MFHDLIASVVADLPVMNHHEHAWKSFNLDQEQEYDLPYFLGNGYLSGDLEAAGLHIDETLFDYLVDALIPDGTDAAWRVIRPYLDRVRNTSYFRYLLRSLKDLFDVTETDIFSERWREASDRIRQYSRAHKGRGAELCARMGVSATVLDANVGPAELAKVDAAGHTLIQVARMDMFIHEERGLADTLDQYSPTDFDAWLAAFDAVFRRSLDAGAVGFKSGLAYNRRIEYSDPTIDQAAQIFMGGLLFAPQSDKITYQDFIMNRLCQRCVEADVPLQIHTGIQAYTRHTLENTRPTLLTGIFQRHGDLRVDLFHGGYPWTVHAGLMAKYFPNVYIDGCWLSHISPSAYRSALTSWIETVPMNKILAWGGDHNLLEHSYASLALARELITEVLTDLVSRDFFDIDVAIEIAKRILYTNGAEFWRVGEA